MLNNVSHGIEVYFSTISTKIFLDVVGLGDSLRMLKRNGFFHLCI